MTVFYRIKFLNTKRGQLAGSLCAYMIKQDWHSDVVDKWFRHSAGRDEVMAFGTLLPECAPPEFRHADGTPDPHAIWNAADRTGISKNKKNKRPKWKKSAQLAMHVIGSLPCDATDETRGKIAEQHADEYRRRGAAVTWSVHNDPWNPHFHLLVSTREVTAKGFEGQLRNLAASFSRGKDHDRATIQKDSPPKRWRAWLENYAREQGLQFDFSDPFAIPGMHWNEGPHGILSRNKALDAEAFAAAQVMVRDPKQLLELVTSRQAVFTRRDLLRILSRHQIPDAEARSIAEKAVADSEILHLRDAGTEVHRELFTTIKARSQEMRILDAARRIHRRALDAEELLRLRAAVAKLKLGRPLSNEQRRAMEHCVGTDGLALVQGLAGAGKSFTMAMIRQAFELAGYRVIGTAPTNAVSSDMASDGFKTASTIHQELLRQENQCRSCIPWDEKTCIIVDEAAMLDAGIYERLLIRAAAAGARVILVGDDKQLSSIERGGIYAHLRKTFDCAMLREVRRQNDDWQKEASLNFAEGHILEGLRAYDKQRCITYHRDIAGASVALVRQRSMDRAADPKKPRYVIAATRDAVQNLNLQCQSADWAQTPPVQTGRFKTAEGDIELGIGDRVQFAANERTLGIVNGLLGTVVAMTANAITVEADGGKTITFDPKAFDKWGLGFAGTVFRSQGRTHAQVYCLYDHTFAWGASTSYVAFTRHRESVRCYVPRTLAPDIETLAQQMSKSDPRTSSLEFVSEEEVRGEIAAGPALAEQMRKTAQDASAVLVPKSAIVLPAGPSNTPNAPTATGDSAIVPKSFDRAPDADILPAGIGTTGGGAASAAGKQTAPLPPLPFKAILAGRGQDFDLSLPQDVEQMMTTLGSEPMPTVVSVYRTIQATAKSSEAVVAGHLRAILKEITIQSRERGFVPRDEEIYRDLLRRVRPDPQNIMANKPLKSGPKEVDIRPLVEPLYESQPRVRKAFESKLKGFVIEALRAIDDSLAAAVGRAGRDDDLRYPIINKRLWLYDLTYRWKLDLRPDITQELGRQATPNEYRDWITLAREAEAADMPEIEWDPPERSPARARAPKHYYDSHLMRETELIGHYDRRITAQIASAEAAILAAKARPQAVAFGGPPSADTDEAALELHLELLRRKRAAFEKDRYGTIRSAPALDFLPATFTEEDVAAPRSHKFRYLLSTGFRAPDRATQFLEDLILGQLIHPTISLPGEAAISHPARQSTPRPDGPQLG